MQTELMVQMNAHMNIYMSKSSLVMTRLRPEQINLDLDKLKISIELETMGEKSPLNKIFFKNPKTIPLSDF